MSHNTPAHPDAAELAVRMSESVMRRNPLFPLKWSYDYGVVFKGMEAVYRLTGDVRFFDYIHANMDQFVTDTGDISGYSVNEYNIDHVNNGKALLFLYRETGLDKYRTAAHLLDTQLAGHPRTKEGGFWHKQIYPHQMWLDGLYMGQPFRAEFARLFDRPADLDDIARQLLLMERKARDPKSGLLYHGWDESRLMDWANPVTGCSPNFWGRAMGWYAMSLVDVLEHLPKTHRDYAAICAVLQRTLSALLAVQDEATGLWLQVLDGAGRRGNYVEASASCMVVYALAKGVRLGALPFERFAQAAEEGYAGILKRFISTDSDGLLTLNGTCEVAGLGNVPYRDGSFAYYISERVIANDLKGIGAFIKASVEMA